MGRGTFPALLAGMCVYIVRDQAPAMECKSQPALFLLSSAIRARYRHTNGGAQ
jgi:hypothetical protein